MIEEALLERRMPPWHADPHNGKFANDRSLSAAESQLLLRWIKQGSPRDEGEDPLTAPVAQAPEWKLGKPDFVVATLGSVTANVAAAMQVYLNTSHITP